MSRLGQSFGQGVGNDTLRRIWVGPTVGYLFGIMVKSRDLNGDAPEYVW